MDDLLQEFIAETRETLEALAGEIVAWEASPGDRERLDAIFRFVHTVKGSCGFLDLPRLARLSHAAEDVLAAVRAGDRAPDRALVNAVLAVVDRIGEIVEAIDTGAPLDDSGEDLLIAALAEGAAEPDAAVAVMAPVGSRVQSRSVRLNVDLLDRMMSGMSDMVLARNELSRRLRSADVDPQVEAALERMSATVADLRDTVTRTRMQRIDALFSALPRMVRDTAASLGKAVLLQIEGAEVELDREMIEVLRDPLVHIIRNAIDHGIETPAQRRAAGKRDTGRLTVSARQSGNQILVEIADDGRGIDVERLIAQLVRAGRDERALRSLNERAQLALIFEPGLTTKDEVTQVSGRGVGMDVVRAAIEQIGGRIELHNAPGHGLRIAIHVPLTLSIIPTIVVGAGGQSFAIPRQAIEEIVSERNAALRTDRIGGAWVATLRERRLPMIVLSDLMGLEPVDRDRVPMVAIVSIGEGSYALRVDDVLDNEELVIKPAAPVVMATGLYAGQTLPDNGCPMLLLDCAGLAREAGLRFDRARAVEETEGDVALGDQPLALVFDDLDGARRAIPLDVVDRIERVAPGAIHRSAGRLRLTLDGQMVPVAMAEAGDLARTGSVLRLRDGVSEIGYAIAEAADIVAMPLDIAPAVVPGSVAGVALIDGDPVELLDPHWLFGEHGDAAAVATPPLCLLGGGDKGWLGTFIQPLLEGAGYRVVTALPPGEQAQVVLTLDAEPERADGAAVVRLCSQRQASGDGAIYRYDRAALLGALAQAVGRGAA